ncbi:DUF6011 domain-containing protein [Alteribacter populi]|uniref:DUF6011 domain-containing protein n=1 Tax=Alteribacter populi TaxID=2011011 RepID=UPI003CC9321C
MECLRCGRKLKDKKSMDRKYGPTCWRKIQEEPDLIYHAEITEGDDHETRTG